MNTTKDTSIAELTDKFMPRVARLTILAVFVCIVSATARIVAGELGSYLTRTEKWLFILSVVLVGLLSLAIKRFSFAAQFEDMVSG